MQEATPRQTSFLIELNLFLNRFIPVTTPLAVALGLIFPGVFINLRPFVIFLFAVMTFSGALKFTAAELVTAVKNPIPILLFFITSHAVMPSAALLLSSVVFSSSDIISGFVLLFAGPTAVSGFFWVAIFKGDKALGLALILLDTFLAPLIVPATLSIFVGQTVSIDMSGIAVSLLFMVVAPTIIAVALNETSKGKIPKIVCPPLDPAAKICLILVIAANSSAVAPDIKFNDPQIWIICLLCVTLTTAGFLLAKLNGIAARCGSQKSASLIIAGGLRNNSVVMTIAVTFFPETAVFPAIMSIIVQQTLTAVMGRVLTRKKDEQAEATPDIKNCNEEQTHPE